MAVMLGTPSLAPVCSESELIAAARGGDDRAYGELYTRYRERIGAFILGRVRDHGRAEDIVQEVFMSALRRLRASDGPIAFKPWIYEIAKNACIDEFRRSQRAREVSLDVDEEHSGGVRALPSIAPSPPAAVESKQRLQDLRGAFGGLSDSHHQLLVMREFEGLSYDEIGRRTGMSRQVVESALFRARRKLSEEYDALASGRRCQQVQSAIDDGRAQSARSLGVRESRQLARHLAHCQQCRASAHLAGVDQSLLVRRSIGAKIAALLPLPLWRWPWRAGARARNAVARTGSHSLAVRSAQGAALAPEPVGAVSSLGGAAIAVAVIAIGGAGGAVVSGLSGSGHSGRAAATPAAHALLATPAAGASAERTARASGARTASAESLARARALSAGRRTQSTLASGRSASGPPAASRTGARSGSPLSGAPSPVGKLGVGSSVPGGVSSATGGSATAASQTATGALSAVHHVLSTVTGSGSDAPSVAGPLKGVSSTLSSSTSTVGSTASSTVGSTTSTVGPTTSAVGSTASSTVGSTSSSALGSTSSGGSASTTGAAVKQLGSTVSSTTSNLLH